MKRSFCLVLLLCLLVCPVSAAPAISARAAVLLEPTSGNVVYGKQETERLPMASTTKIMTALVALESDTIHDGQETALDTSYAIPAAAVGVEGSSIYLQPDEHLTLRELLYAVLLESANDAATAVACIIDGDVETFATRMNAKAVELGLTNTHFTNPHGLDNPAHYTTALDLARLTAYAMQNPTFAEIVSTVRYTIPLHDGEGTRVLVNHNRLLRQDTEVIGVKTGYTKVSGRCLVTAAERDGVRMIAVTLDAPDDWQDHRQLLEYGFAAYASFPLATPGSESVSLPCVGGELHAQNTEGLTLVLPKDSVITKVVESRGVWFAPVSAGETVGVVRYFADGRAVGELPLYADTAVNMPIRHKWLERLLDF